MIRLFLKKQTNRNHTAEEGKKVLNKTRNQVSNKVPMKRKAGIVMVLILLLSIGGNVQVYAAGTKQPVIIIEKVPILAENAYTYQLMNTVFAGSTYPSMEGLALGNGKAYVLKTNGKAGTKCILFAGEKTNLVEIEKNLKVFHGNDMTYRQLDGKLYVAPRKRDADKKKQFIYRMTTNGKVDAEIETKYVVGSIACWLNYDKKNNKDAFVLKDIGGLFHIVQINGTKLKELCQFNVDKINGETLNQGICMYDGYLYVTYWENKSGNSYVYRVDKKMSTVLKESKAGTTKSYSKTCVVTLDKQNLLKSLPKKPNDFHKPVKVEIESIAFTGGYLYFTANANYADKAGNSHCLDGLYKVKRKLA